VETVETRERGLRPEADLLVKASGSFGGLAAELRRVAGGRTAR